MNRDSIDILVNDLINTRYHEVAMFGNSKARPIEYMAPDAATLRKMAEHCGRTPRKTEVALGVGFVGFDYRGVHFYASSGEVA